MKRIPCFILIILLTLSLLGAGCTSPATPTKGWLTPLATQITPSVTMVPQSVVTMKETVPVTIDNPVMRSLLGRIEGRVNRSLDSLDRNISGVAKSLGSTGISGNAANNVLADLSASSSVIDAVTVTRSGTIAAAMPPRYQNVIGETVANQSHIIKGFATAAPVLSGEFTTVEGFNASAIVYPVQSADGVVFGLLSVPFLPASLLSDAISPLMDNNEFEVTVIQTDGRIIYATNTSQVGMMSLSDPLFVSRPDLIRFVKQVVSTNSGSGTYTVPDMATKKNVTVENYWTTVSLHGTPWRIILDTIR